LPFPIERRPASHFEVSVVVPTYRRPDELRRCLAGLATQSLAPAEIIVVRREGDEATRAALKESAHAAVVDAVVSEPGVLAAMQAGAAVASRDLIAFIDDDAVPRREWLERLTRHFEDPKVGGVGGRDVIADQPVPRGAALEVGRITRWGKLVGNHHLGTGSPRDVMVLKAVGVAFRRIALALPYGLRGAGAQVHFEVGMSLAARRLGWRLVYDPSALVDHEVAQRFDADLRERPRPVAVRDAAYNLVKCLLMEVPELFWRRAIYGLAVGDRDTPGVARAGIALLRGERRVLRRFVPSLAGQAAALREARMIGLRGGRSLASSSAKRRPRVALLAHDIHDNGGMERACLELLNRAAHKVEFVVISGHLDPKVRSSVRWRRVPLPRRPFPLKFVAFYVLAGLRLAFERVDLVHTVGAIVPNKVDVASVHFCHAGFRASGAQYASPSSWTRRLNKRISRRLALITERWSYRQERVRLLASVSLGVERELSRFYPGVDVVMTPNGVAHDRFRPDADAYRRTRRETGVETDECVALFVGGDWDRKGLGVAIRGLREARLEGAPVRLWVVGPGDRTRFEALAARLGVAEQVHFFGRRTDTELFYRAADVFAMPTLYETFCLAAFEAAACALPVVVTPVHGVKDLVGRDAAGIRVERTPEAVGRALVRLAADRDLRASLGANARRRAAEFTWDRSVDSVLASYAALLHASTPNAASSGNGHGVAA
jgi:glycosyltransferase involved in cell wall biosynthesis/GT2 family glycosyltransferase